MLKYIQNVCGNKSTFAVSGCFGAKTILCMFPKKTTFHFFKAGSMFCYKLHGKTQFATGCELCFPKQHHVLGCWVNVLVSNPWENTIHNWLRIVFSQVNPHIGLLGQCCGAKSIRNWLRIVFSQANPHFGKSTSGACDIGPKSGTTTTDTPKQTSKETQKQTHTHTHTHTKKNITKPINAKPETENPITPQNPQRP